jgi:hypothetical protein
LPVRFLQDERTTRGQLRSSAQPITFGRTSSASSTFFVAHADVRYLIN